MKDKKYLEDILSQRIEKHLKGWQEFAQWMVDFCKRMEEKEKLKINGSGKE